MEQSSLTPQAWLKQAKSQGFVVELAASQAPKGAPSRPHRPILQIILVERLWWATKEDEPANPPAGWDDQQQTDWANQATAVAVNLLDLVPAHGATKVWTSPGKVGSFEAEVRVHRVDVDPDFWSVVERITNTRIRHETRRRELNLLFDQKIEQELREDPDLLAIELQQAELIELAAKTLRQKRQAKETERKRFLYVADDEGMSRDGL